MEDLLRKFYNDIKANSKVGEHKELLETIEKEIDTFTAPQASGAVAAEEVHEEDQQWDVPVARTGYGNRTMVVTARSESEAIEKAIDTAGSESFSEHYSEYKTPDGAHRQLPWEERIQVDIQSADKWKIDKIDKGHYTQRGSVEDGPAVDIELDPEKRDGYILTKHHMGYLMFIAKDVFFTAEDEMKKYLTDQGFEEGEYSWSKNDKS